MNTQLAINGDEVLSTSTGYWRQIFFDNSAGSDISLAQIAECPKSTSTLEISKVTWCPFAGTMQCYLAMADSDEIAKYTIIYRHGTDGTSLPEYELYEWHPLSPIRLARGKSLYAFIDGEMNGAIDCEYKVV